MMGGITFSPFFVKLGESGLGDVIGMVEKDEIEKKSKRELRE
jgi:hypothetical protein